MYSFQTQKQFEMDVKHNNCYIITCLLMSTKRQLQIHAKFKNNPQNGSNLESFRPPAKEWRGYCSVLQLFTCRLRAAKVDGQVARKWLGLPLSLITIDYYRGDEYMQGCGTELIVCLLHAYNYKHYSTKVKNRKPIFKSCIILAVP